MSRYAGPAMFLLLFFVFLAGCNGNGQQTEGLEKGEADSMEMGEDIIENADSFALILEQLESADRENWQKPQVVISQMGDLSDKTVADIGAGTGYFTFRLAAVSHKVIAIDIEDQFLDHIRKNATLQGEDNFDIETRLTEPDNPHLADGEADVVLLVNTYPFINDRTEYFSRVHKGMKAAGRLVIVDFKQGEFPVGPANSDKIPVNQIVTELDSAGFKPMDLDSTSLDYQYILSFSRN